jgi:hypothetical protein
MYTKPSVPKEGINVLHLPIIFPRVGGSPIYPRAGMQNRLLLWQMDCELSQSIWQNFAKETSLADYRLLPGSVTIYILAILHTIPGTLPTN